MSNHTSKANGGPLRMLSVQEAAGELGISRSLTYELLSSVHSAPSRSAAVASCPARRSRRTSPACRQQRGHHEVSRCAAWVLK